jgi:hypothetical protein
MQGGESHTHKRVFYAGTLVKLDYLGHLSLGGSVFLLALTGMLGLGTMARANTEPVRTRRVSRISLVSICGTEKSCFQVMLAPWLSVMEVKVEQRYSVGAGR